MGFYLIVPLVTLIPLGSIFSSAFKPYYDDGLLGISPTVYSFTTLGIRGNLFILAESLAGHSSSTAVLAQMFQLKKT